MATARSADSTVPRRRGRPAGAGTAGSEVQALSRALDVLGELAASPGGISLSELGVRLGLAPSTVHRLLGTLEKHGFASVDAERGAWTVGVEAFTVGNAFLAGRDVVGRARPAMQRLMDESGESVNLAVMEGDEAVFVAQIECREMMRMFVRLGSRAPLHASGVGKALLAALPDERLDALLGQRTLRAFTANTLESPEALRQDLARVRRRGYALDEEEHAVGLCCVAATVHDEHGQPLAAVSLSGPHARITRTRLEVLGRMVRITADDLTTAMGGVLPHWRRQAASPRRGRGPRQRGAGEDES